MKKIISLCSVILIFSLVITVFTACGDNKDDTETSGNSKATTVADTKGFSVEIGEESAIVKKDGKEFQTLKYPVNAGMKFDLDYAKKNNAFKDMNFDGVPDFYIAISNSDGVISYYCWLYNVTKEQFDYSITLSELKNISVDADNHRIFSDVVMSGQKHVISYKWVDGKLTFDSDFSDDNGGIPEEVTQAVADNAIGSEEKPSKETEKADDEEETTKKNSGSSNKTTTKKNSDSENKTTTKPKKPANTTTTAPAVNDSIVIETGDIDDGWF